MIGWRSVESTRGRRVNPSLLIEILELLHYIIGQVQDTVAVLDDVPVEERNTVHLRTLLLQSLQVAHMLSVHIPSLSAKESHKVHQAVYMIVKLNVQGHLGYTALHLACSPDLFLLGRNRVSQLPSSLLADLLLAVGADIHARDDIGNTPLHLAANLHPCPPDLVRVLLDRGAHLDAINSSGQTFQQLLKDQLIHKIVNPLKYTTLSCLAAQIIKKSKLPYKGIVPVLLEHFIEEH